MARFPLTTSEAMPREPNTPSKSRWRRPCSSTRLRSRLSGVDPSRSFGQEFGILPLFRCEFRGVPVEVLQLGDNPLILLLGANNRRELAGQLTAVTLWIYLEH